MRTGPVAGLAHRFLERLIVRHSAAAQLIHALANAVLFLETSGLGIVSAQPGQLDLVCQLCILQAPCRRFRTGFVEMEEILARLALGLCQIILLLAVLEDALAQEILVLEDPQLLIVAADLGELQVDRALEVGDLHRPRLRPCLVQLEHVLLGRELGLRLVEPCTAVLVDPVEQITLPLERTDCLDIAGSAGHGQLLLEADFFAAFCEFLRRGSAAASAAPATGSFLRTAASGHGTVSAPAARCRSVLGCSPASCSSGFVTRPERSRLQP